VLSRCINHPGCNNFRDAFDLRKFNAKHPFKIMTDWKKSGLTLPHWFVGSVIERLKQVVPDGVYIDFPVNGWPIFDPESKRVFHPKGFGYGLGMVNTFYTLFNIVLFEYAKRTGVFSEEDEIFSFNDDSVIGCLRTSYHRWVRVCLASGGYYDRHKTFASLGSMFCEMHQFDVSSNFKWISTFHTCINVIVKARNYDHARYWLGEVWNGVRGWEADDTKGLETSQMFASTIVHYVTNLASKFWGGLPFDNSLPFSLGGCELGNRHTLPGYGLKDDLVLIENEDNPRLANRHKRWFITTYEAMNERFTQYRPWHPFPEGKTKRLLKVLSDFQGVYHELSALGDKIKNKFITDADCVQDQLWRHVNSQLDKLRADDRAGIDTINWNFWARIREKRFVNYALPEKLVIASIEASSEQAVYFLEEPKPRPRISMVAYLEAFMQSLSGQATAPYIEDSDIDLSLYHDIEVPILKNDIGYQPLADFGELSKLSNFAHPKRVILDYWWRTRRIPTELDIVDLRGKACLDFLEPLCDCQGAVIGSWWTPTPLPIKKEWLRYLNKAIPRDHIRVIVDLHEDDRAYELIRDSQITFEELKADQANRAQFWKKAFSKKKKASKSKTRSTGNIEVTEQDPLSMIRHDQIPDTWEAIMAARQFLAPKTEEAKELKPYAPPTELPPPRLSEEELDALIASMNQEEDKEESVYSSENEDDYLASVLDDIGYSYDSEDDLPFG
jgi:hypothetical protein